MNGEAYGERRKGAADKLAFLLSAVGPCGRRTP